MAWTLAQVKAADAALSPAVSDPTAAAVALNAQSAAAAVAFPWSAVKLIVQISASWSKVVLRSRLTDGSAANIAAINATEMSDDTIMHPDNGTAMGQMSAGLSALQAAGDITASDVAAIGALVSAQAPAWQPALTAGDIQTARAQP